MSDKRRHRMLEEMGLGPVWKLRDAPGMPAQASVPTSLESAEAHQAQPQDHARGNESAQQIANMDWEQLQSAVANCTRCDLCQSRTKTVFGVGARKAKWLFVGEGPGRDEDLQGEPFVGAAGKLLDSMLAAMDLKRGVNAFIANIVKCRPTDATGKDRPPNPSEVAACMPYLERQIALIEPTIIVALGKTAALSLLNADPDTPVSKLRGTVHRFGELPLIVTYHPAYLLRNLPDKGKAWRDLCLAMDTYASATLAS